MRKTLVIIGTVVLLLWLLMLPMFLMNVEKLEEQDIGALPNRKAEHDFPWWVVTFGPKMPGWMIISFFGTLAVGVATLILGIVLKENP